VGGWPRSARHRGLGYLGWRSPLHAREGPTPYLVRDGSYFLPAAREITLCRSVLSPRDTEPGSPRSWPRTLRAARVTGTSWPGRHIAAGLATASSWFTGGLPAGRPGRHGSARPAASCVRTVCGHVVSTECGRPPGPTGWRRRGADAGTPDSMWHLAGACLAVGCDPAPVPDQRRGECDQHKDAQEHHPAGQTGPAFRSSSARSPRTARTVGRRKRASCGRDRKGAGQVVGTGLWPPEQAPGCEHQDVAGVVREVVPP
jgi:hypothetical protein